MASKVYLPDFNETVIQCSFLIGNLSELQNIQDSEGFIQLGSGLERRLPELLGKL